MKKRTCFGILLTIVLAAVQVNAQDLDHYKQIVKELSSSKYQGRGYAKGGANKAGNYLAKEFAKAGVDEVICQPFTLDINTFPRRMKMWVAAMTAAMSSRRITTIWATLVAVCIMRAPTTTLQARLPLSPWLPITPSTNLNTTCISSPSRARMPI